MSLLRWIASLFRKSAADKAVEAERYFEPQHRHRLDTAAGNAARGAESGAASIGFTSGP